MKPKFNLKSSWHYFSLPLNSNKRAYFFGGWRREQPKNHNKTTPNRLLFLWHMFMVQNCGGEKSGFFVLSPLICVLGYIL